MVRAGYWELRTLEFLISKTDFSPFHILYNGFASLHGNWRKYRSFLWARAWSTTPQRTLQNFQPPSSTDSRLQISLHSTFTGSCPCPLLWLAACQKDLTNCISISSLALRILLTVKEYFLFGFLRRVWRYSTSPSLFYAISECCWNSASRWHVVSHHTKMVEFLFNCTWVYWILPPVVVYCFLPRVVFSWLLLASQVVWKKEVFPPGNS